MAEYVQDPLPGWTSDPPTRPVVFTSQGPVPEWADQKTSAFLTAPETELLRKIEKQARLIRLLLDPDARWAEILYLRKQLGV